MIVRMDKRTELEIDGNRSITETSIEIEIEADTYIDLEAMAKGIDAIHRNRRNELDQQSKQSVPQSPLWSAMCQAFKLHDPDRRSLTGFDARSENSVTEQLQAFVRVAVSRTPLLIITSDVDRWHDIPCMVFTWQRPLRGIYPNPFVIFDRPFRSASAVSPEIAYLRSFPYPAFYPVQDSDPPAIQKEVLG